MRAHRILIVDDEPDILILLRLALQAAGYEIAEASDGRAAIDRLHEGGFDLVLLDAMMPMMDGWAALEGMRDLERRPPVIMVSAKTAEADRARALRLGASAYITKPFEPSRLIEAMEDIIRRSPAPDLSVAWGTSPE